MAENMKAIGKIFFDMDGVLADFDRGVRELCTITPAPQDEGKDPGFDDRMWAAIRETDRFYDRLELMPGAKELFDRIYGIYGDRCEILTGVPKPKRGILTAEEDKKNWVRRLLSEKIVIHTVLKADKPDFCTGPECLLIDDLKANIDNWTKAGGTGILHRSAKETLKELEALGWL